MTLSPVLGETLSPGPPRTVSCSLALTNLLLLLCSQAPFYQSDMVWAWWRNRIPCSSYLLLSCTPQGAWALKITTIAAFCQVLNLNLSSDPLGSPIVLVIIIIVIPLILIYILILMVILQGTRYPIVLAIYSFVTNYPPNLVTFNIYYLLVFVRSRVQAGLARSLAT